MADSRFFENSGPKTLKELADISGASLYKDEEGEAVVEDVAALDKAGPEDISFLDNVKYKDQFSKTEAGACIVSADWVDLAPPDTALLITDSPYKAYAKIARVFYPENQQEAGIAELASIHDSAEIGDNCFIDEGAVIKAGAKIGDESWIGPHAVIGENVELGRGCSIGANSVVTHSLVGDHTRIYRGCCIGQDGFGFAVDPSGFVKVPQLGRVIIGDHVEIGANTTIDRGSASDTVIGQGTWIDNLVQIAHNVKIGKGCIIVAQVGISGSSVIEDYAVLAGQVGVAGHLTIGSGARVAAQSGIMRDVPAGQEVMGSPAMPAKSFMRQVATLKRMIKTKKTKK